MAYHAKVRCLGIHDIFHREWNDCTLALKSCDLWYVILLTSMVMNLPYGPWDGSSWFSKMQEAAFALQSKTKPGELWS
eukprot:4059141-Lingulodinium_polyedra.AAC.1